MRAMAAGDETDRTQMEQVQAVVSIESSIHSFLLSCSISANQGKRTNVKCDSLFLKSNIFLGGGFINNMA